MVSRATPSATIYTDEGGGYQGMPFDHKTVCYGVDEYVSDMAHTNGIESFWSMLKRGYLVSRSGSFYPSARRPFRVMAGFIPAIHVFARRRVGLAERDARIKSGHDEFWKSSVGETENRPDRMRMNFRNTTLGTYHHMSAKHLNRYMTEFSGRHNGREADNVEKMSNMARGMVGRRLRYDDLVD